MVSAHAVLALFWKLLFHGVCGLVVLVSGWGNFLCVWVLNGWENFVVCVGKSFAELVGE